MNSKKTINVLHLRSSNFYGGPERQIHFHAKHAALSGVNVRISSFSENKKAPDFITKISADNLSTKLFNVKNAYDISSIKQIRSYLKINDIDILCTHEYRSHFYGFMASRKTPVKWVAFSRGMTKENLKIMIFTYLEKYFLKRAEHIVAVSESQKQKLVKQSIDSQKITTIHNAIDTAFINSIEPVSIKHRFSLSNDSFICISAGRFSEEKGQLYLIKAAEISIQENKKLRFILFGDGPDLINIQSYIKQNNLEKYIICPGFEKNVLGYIKTADLLINPSLSEGLPNIVLEALASKIPVIVTNVGGHPEIVTDNKNGYLVEPKDITRLSEKILKLADPKQNFENFPENSLTLLKEKFSFKSQNKKLLDLYAQLTTPRNNKIQK